MATFNATVLGVEMRIQEGVDVDVGVHGEGEVNGKAKAKVQNGAD